MHIAGLQINKMYLKSGFFTTKTYVVGAQTNRLNGSFETPKQMMKLMD